MKDEIGDLTKQSNDDYDVYKILDDWIDYYNTDRPKTNLASETPVKYYQYLLNGGEIIRSKKYKRKRKILKIKLYSNLSLTLGTVHHIFLKFHFRKIRIFPLFLKIFLFIRFIIIIAKKFKK